jgi:hypothetical protein
MSNNSDIDGSDSRQHRSGAQYSYTNQQNIGSDTRRRNPGQKLYPDLSNDHLSNHLINKNIENNEDIEDNEHIENIHNNENLSDSIQETIETKTKEPQNNYKSFIFILLIISLIIYYFGFDGNTFFSDYFNTKNEMTINQTNNWLIFENEFNSFENKYNKVLPDIGLKVMKKAVKRVMNKTSLSLSSSKSSYPAVILLIGSNEQLKLFDCIANDFLKIINKAYNEVNSNQINGKQTNTSDIKEKFEQTFAIQRKHTIIVKNIESIPSNHIMALHQFTDHQNSKFPDSIIILTAINHKRIDLNKKAGMRQMDETATQLFEMKWNNSLAGEQISALNSRLTPSVVTVLYDSNNEIKC